MIHALRQQLAMVAGIVAWGPATWWVGNLVSRGTTLDDPDYLIRPVRLAPLVAPAIGVAGVALVVVGLVIRRRLASGWRQIVTASSAISAYVGLTYQVATTPVIGANIGGGMMYLFAVPFGIGMVVWIVIAALDIRRGRSQTESGSRLR